MTRRQRPDRKRDLLGLLGENAADLTQPQTAERRLPVGALRVGASQPRRAFDELSLNALAQSIRADGVLQPLLVRPVEGGYELVAGERRWRAAQLAGLSEVPVVVRELSEAQARRLALIENLQREDLNTLDEVDAKLQLVAEVLGTDATGARARLMQLLREERGSDHEALDDLFAALGEQWSSFTRNKLKILNWPAPLLEAVRGGLAYTTAQVIAQADPDHHEELIALAGSGATRGHLQAEVRRLRPKPAAPDQARRVGKSLGSARWLSDLSAAEKRELAAWLAKMPPALKKKVRG